MSMMIPLFKVDEARREVIGRATQEVIDKSGEILDYESSKENFRKWSEEIYKLSGGKSYGNLRSMHGNIAAGKLIKIEFNDDEKAIDVVAKITDDNEWKKVVEGVYTGFSIGGGYEKRWQDPENPGITRYTAKPTELSLVDNPCIPTARFYDLIKADGSIERREIKTLKHEPEIKPLTEEDAAGDAAKPDSGQPLGTTPRNENELRKQPLMFDDLVKANWDESKVNRDEKGRFAPKGPTAKDAVVAGLGAVAGAVAARRSPAVRSAARRIGDAVAGFQSGFAAGTRGRRGLVSGIGQGVKSARRRAAAGRRYDAELAARSRKGPGYSMGPGGEAKAMREIRDRMGVRSAAISGAVAAGGIHNVTRREQRVQQQDDGNKARKAALFNELMKWDESKVVRDKNGRFAPKSGGSDSFNQGEIIGGIIGSTLGTEAGNAWGHKQGFEVARRARGLAGTAGGLVGVATGREVQRLIEREKDKRKIKKALSFEDLYKNSDIVHVSSYTRRGPDGQTVEVRAHTRGGGSGAATAAGVAGGALAVGAAVMAIRKGKAKAVRRAALLATRKARREVTIKELESHIGALEKSLRRTKKGSKRNAEIKAEIAKTKSRISRLKEMVAADTKALEQKQFVDKAIEWIEKTAASKKESVQAALGRVVNGIKRDIRTANIRNLRRKAQIVIGLATIGGVVGDLFVGNQKLSIHREIRPDGSTYVDAHLTNVKTGDRSFIFSYDSAEGLKLAPMGAIASAYVGLAEDERTRNEGRGVYGSRTQYGGRTVAGAGSNVTSPDSPFHPSRNNRDNPDGIRINNPFFDEKRFYNFAETRQRLNRIYGDIAHGAEPIKRKAYEERYRLEASIPSRDWTDEAKSRALTISRFGTASIGSDRVRGEINGILARAEREPSTLLNDSRWQADQAFIRYAPYIPRRERDEYESMLMSARRAALQARRSEGAERAPAHYGSKSAEDARRAVSEELGEDIFDYDDFGKSATSKPLSFNKVYQDLSDPDRPLKKVVSLAKAIPPFPGESRQAYVDRILLNAGI